MERRPRISLPVLSQVQSSQPYEKPPNPRQMQRMRHLEALHLGPFVKRALDVSHISDNSSIASTERASSNLKARLIGSPRRMIWCLHADCHPHCGLNPFPADPRDAMNDDTIT